MATSNFGSTIFSHLYTVDVDDRDDYDFARDNIAGALAALPGGYEDHTNGEQIAHIYYEDVVFCGVPYEIRLDVYLRPGYYSGAWLDGRFYIDGEECNIYELTKSDFADMLANGLIDCDMCDAFATHGRMQGFCMMQAGNLARHMAAAYTRLLDRVGSAVSPYTEQLRCIGPFSNGASIYERIE